MASESIEMRPLNQDSTDPTDQIMEIIKDYENRYKVFSSTNLSSKEAIFQKIRTMLSIELNIDIELLFQHDYNSFNMIMAAFFCQKHALNIPQEGQADLNGEKDFLPFCQHPLHTVMVMCYAAHSMQKMILKDDFAQTLRQEKYEQLKEQLEELACKIINKLYLSEDGGIAVREALQADYKSEFRVVGRRMTAYEEYLYRKFDKSKEIMTVAYKAKAMKFLSQRPCLNLMKHRNSCRRVDNSAHGDGQQANPKRKNWISTNWKLFIHAFFRTLYILLFAYMLCKFPVYDDLDVISDRELIEIIPYCYVICVLIAQISMTFIKAVDYLNFQTFQSIQVSQNEGHSSRRIVFFRFFIGMKTSIHLIRNYFKSNRLALWRVYLVVPLLLLEAVQFVVFTVGRKNKLKSDETFWYGGWVLIPIALELLYCALFAIATVSSLRFFHFVQSLGFFVHLFKKMWKTVGMFVLIFCTFWFVLAVIHVSISRTFMFSTNTIFYTVSSQGKFEIFGEVQDDDRTGKLSDCGHFNRTVFDFFEMDYAEASCLFRSSVMPFLVFTYIFVTGILLVNLLTAQLTKEYEKESEKSRYFKGYLKYEQLAKIESKLYLPPPLSLIYVGIRLVIGFFTGISCLVNLISSCCRNLGHKCKSGSCRKSRDPELQSGASMCSGASKRIYKQLIERMEGYPWGAVRDMIGPSTQTENESMSAEDKIKQFLTESQNIIWEKLKEVVIQYDRDIMDAEKLDQLEKSVSAVFENEKKEERERAASRIGVTSQSVLVEASIDDLRVTPPPTFDITETRSSMDRGSAHIQDQNSSRDRRNRLGPSRSLGQISESHQLKSLY